MFDAVIELMISNRMNVNSEEIHRLNRWLILEQC